MKKRYCVNMQYALLKTLPLKSSKGTIGCADIKSPTTMNGITVFSDRMMPLNYRKIMIQWIYKLYGEQCCLCSAGFFRSHDLDLHSFPKRLFQVQLEKG